MTVRAAPAPGHARYRPGAWIPGLRKLPRRFVATVAALTALALSPGFAEDRAPPGHAASQTTRVWMRNITIYPFDDAPTTIDRLSGTLTPTRAGRIVNMDDVTSYSIEAGRAEVRVPPETLSVLLNRYVLPAAGTDIGQVTVRMDNGAIQLRGKLKKAGIAIGFKATALASATAQGEIRLQVVRMRAAGFIPKSLLDALGLTMARVAQPENRRIFRIEKDTLYVPVASVFPPPKFSGRLKSVRITPRGLIAVLEGAGATAAPPPQRSRSFLIFRGGRVQFGKLTMTHADMTLLPRKPGPTLGFSATHYYRQLVAGYSVSKPDLGLVSYVADYRDLSRGHMASPQQRSYIG